MSILIHFPVSFSCGKDCLDILGFTDFKPVHFVTKCYTLNSSQKPHFCRLSLGKYYLSRYQRFMSTDEDRNKDLFENRKLWFGTASNFSTERVDFRSCLDARRKPIKCILKALLRSC